MAELTKEGYLEHLIDIRDKLIDFIEFINQDKRSYFKDISMKLRILYMQKSGTPPLLESIESLYGFEISVWNTYSFSEAVENGELPPSVKLPEIDFHNGPLLWFENFGKKKDKIKLIDAFKREKMIVIHGNFFSIKRIVEVIADKMGGAHIDNKINEKDLLPHSNQLLFGDLTTAHQIIYSTSIQTIKALNMIIDFINTRQETEFIKNKPNQKNT